jgi:phasin
LRPTLSETIGMAAETFAGTIIDLSRPKQKAHRPCVSAEQEIKRRKQMAKKPTGSSDASGGASSSAGGKSDPAQGVRQAADSTLAQARQAVDQYIREATRLYGAMEASAEAAQSGTREVNRKAIGFAETNVNAAFDFAQQLVRAKDPKEIVQLQQEFLKRQVEQMSSQMKELGEHATQTAQTASAAARPKT